jgi:glycosyltransferase involved in cell wall biosynthesis
MAVMGAMGARIGFDVTAAVTQGGGIGRYTREIIHALLAEDQENTYRLFSARPAATLPVPDSVPVGDNVTFHPAPLDERWLYRLWYRLRLPIPIQLVTGPIDLFHSPDFVLPPVAGRIPTVLTVHDLSFVHYPETFPPALVRYLNRLVPWSIRRASHILADSESTRRDLLRIWSVPEEKLSVLYSGVHARFQPVQDEKQRAEVRARYGLGNTPYILAVGTIQPRKNYALLISAFSRIANDMPHNLVIVGGKGWLYETLLNQVDNLPDKERVRFPGFVTDADLPVLYSAADLFVFPSLYEGFGLPLLEAMACGVPVLSSNASSLPEVVDEKGEAAVLLPPEDKIAWSQAMQRLLTDGDQRERMIKAGLRHVRNFSWQSAARQLLLLYHTLLDR